MSAAFFRKNRRLDSDSGASISDIRSSGPSMMTVQSIQDSKPKRKLWKKLVIVAVVLIMIVGSVFAFRMLTVSQSIFAQGDDRPSFLDQIKALAAPGKKLEGEESDRVNILLLGHGGEEHPGGELNDTIMVASIKPSSGEVALVSFPRDLYVNSGSGSAKINSIQTFADQKQPGTGIGVMTATVERIAGIEIPYYIRVDFDGFIETVNKLGGVDVSIPRSFYDDLHRIQYNAGVEHFDGLRALLFVRARYVQGPEGGDFARARRAQLVLGSLKDKVLELNPVVDIGKVNGILGDLGNHVKTNFEPSEFKRLYELTKDVDVNSDVINKVVDNRESDLLYSTSMLLGGVNAYVLRPKDSSWSQIQNMIQSVFHRDYLGEEDAPISVQNGTTSKGLAGKVGDDMEDANYNVTQIIDADRNTYTGTVIIDQSGGSFPHTIDLLANWLKGSYGITPEVKKSSTSQNRIVLILGSDAAPIIQ